MQQISDKEDEHATACHQGDAEQNGFRSLTHKGILAAQRRLRQSQNSKGEKSWNAAKISGFSQNQ